VISRRPQWCEPDDQHALPLLCPPQMEFMWAKPGLLVPYIEHRHELRVRARESTSHSTPTPRPSLTLSCALPHSNSPQLLRVP
jgi:hypothetical protein